MSLVGIVSSLLFKLKWGLMKKLNLSSYYNIGKPLKRHHFHKCLKRELGKVFFQSDLKSNLNYNIECTSNSIQQ